SAAVQLTTPSVLLLFAPHVHPRPPPSFPTRRSSDLHCAACHCAACHGAASDGAASDGRASPDHGGTDILERAHSPMRRRYLQLRSEEHTSELQSRENLVCRLLLEKKKKKKTKTKYHR